MSKVRRATLALLCLSLAAGTPAIAGSPVNKSLFGGVAIDGYDPVAYFVDGKPVEGSKQWSHDWQGATWHFASPANRDRFAAEPGKYAPQYGGYCAWAVGHGYTAGIDPDAWTIHDGKLYLNYDLEIRSKWLQDVPGWIAAGDKNWPKLLAD
jgi:YHS domain-containing protein